MTLMSFARSQQWMHSWLIKTWVSISRWGVSAIVEQAMNEILIIFNSMAKECTDKGFIWHRYGNMQSIELYIYIGGGLPCEFPPGGCVWPEGGGTVEGGAPWLGCDPVGVIVEFWLGGVPVEFWWGGVPVSVIVEFWLDGAAVDWVPVGMNEDM